MGASWSKDVLGDRKYVLVWQEVGAEGLALGIRVRIRVWNGLFRFSRFNVRVRVSAWWLRHELVLNLVVRVHVNVTTWVGVMFKVAIWGLGIKLGDRIRLSVQVRVFGRC